MSQMMYTIENPNVVTRNLKSILFNEEFADVTIVAGGGGGLPTERIPAHKQILAASSDIFKAMLFGQFTEGKGGELSIPSVSPTNMKSLL